MTETPKVKNQLTGPFGFGTAMFFVESGLKVKREGWNGKDMFIFLVDDWIYIKFEIEKYERLPFIAMKTADNKIVPWLASQTDILAKDWFIH